MHSALFINEILQLIFETVLDDDKSSLCYAARCCQAWKEPALDLIWRRLASAIPLLSLLPGFSMENNHIRLDPVTQDTSLSVFRSYSTRVKHIAHCHRVIADLSATPVHHFHQSSNLESVRIDSRAIGEVTLCMSLSPRLRVLHLQMSYTKYDSATTMHGLMSLLQRCSSLERLSVRGYSSKCLSVPLGGISTLRSLSLHLSSLTERSFMTVSTFSLLEELDVHADHLSYDDLSAAMARTHDGPFFPALERLKIRSQPLLIALIVQRIPRNKLRSFHVDATGSFPPPILGGLFQALATLPLFEFVLEHAILDGVAYTPNQHSALEHFRPLSKLPLRRFILDSSLPPDLPDAAIVEMVKWWPLLDQLELGACTALDNAETTWNPACSLASLCTLAKGCKHLKSLIITLDVDSTHSLLDLSPVSPASHPLTSLSISSRSRPDVSSLSALLSQLFPSLRDVTPGFVGEHEDAWAAVQQRIQNSSDL